MRSVIIALLLQAFPMPPRAALENPAVLSPVPKKMQKDYDKLWQRFTKAKDEKDDAKIIKDTDKLLKKNRGVVPLMILEAYIDLYNNRPTDAERKFESVLSSASTNRTALSYLAEFAFAREDYARASDIYSRLLETDPTRTDVEPKREKALLLATENLIRNAAEAEQAGRFADAESLYRHALQIAPHEPLLHEKLGELLGKQKKWDQALAEFKQERELGGSPDDADRHLAEALANLGRAEEAREIIERLRKSGAVDVSLDAKFSELEDIGRWGKDIAVFRNIQSTPELTRAQLAALIVRYFPQLTELRQTSQVLTDIHDSWAQGEIQTVVGMGLLDPRPNHSFEPSVPITRGELAAALARLSRLLKISLPAAPPIPTTDVGSRNALYRDIQMILGYAVMTLDDSGSFNINGKVSGEDGVHAVARLLELSRGVFNNQNY